METNVDRIYKQALELSDEHKALLAERIVEYLGVNADPSIERLHLDIVRRRRKEIEDDKVQLVDGGEALSKARKAIGS